MENRLLKKILRSLGAMAGGFGIIFLCVGLAAVFAWPLWFWATNFSCSYTACILAVSAALLIWQIVRVARKSSARHVIFVFLRILIVALGIAATAWLILSGKRFVAVGIFIGFIFVMISVSSLEKPRGAAKK